MSEQKKKGQIERERKCTEHTFNWTYFCKGEPNDTRHTNTAINTHL